MKKIVAVIMTLIMLLCVLPVGVFAEPETQETVKISKIDIVLVAPVYGEISVDDSIAKTEGVTVESVKWYDVTNSAYLEEGDVYQQGLTRAEVTVSADEGYEFSEIITGLINEQKADSVVVNEDGTVTVVFAFSVSPEQEGPGFFANVFAVIKNALLAFVRLIGTFIFGLK